MIHCIKFTGLSLGKTEVRSSGAYRRCEVRTNLRYLSASGAQTMTHCAPQFKQVRICAMPSKAFSNYSPLLQLISALLLTAHNN